MKKIILSFLSILCIGAFLLGIAACSNEEYEIYVEGYTLQIEENGDYSIIGIPREILNQTTWRVPEKIGEYPISHLGSTLRVHGMWSSGDTLGNLGLIRRIYIPACIKSIDVNNLNEVAIWETEAPLSQIKFYESFPYETEVCFISPVEEDGRNVRYITEENIIEENMVICANEEGTEATVVVAIGGGSLEIPDTFNGLPVTKIGDRAFSNEGFERMTLGANIKEIGESAFLGVPITQIELFEGITTIGEYAFCATNLTSVTLPSTVTTLGVDIFRNAKLESFDLSKTQITTIPTSTFRHCPLSGELKFSENITKIDSYAFCGSGVTEIQLPESLTHLEDMAFGDCSNLKSLRLPDGVSHFYASVVAGCDVLESFHLNMIETYSDGSSYTYKEWPALQEITVSENNENMVVENGILYNKKESVLYRCPAKLPIERITIDSVRVEKDAFYGNQYLKEVIFTEKNQSIDDSAFENCTSLESVQLSSRLVTISFAAFRNCSSLKTVNTENVQYFLRCCFANCSSLQNVDLSSSRQIGSEAFFSCDLREVKLGSGCTVDMRAFADNQNLTSFDTNGGTLKNNNVLYNTPLYDDGEEETWKDVVGDFLCKIFPFLRRTKS